MVAIVDLSVSGSSARYWADSACARITASEWPTTSCTSRASRACSSRSRAISCACAASRWARAASACALSSDCWDRRARAMNRSDRPASQGAPSAAVPMIAAPTCHVSPNRYAVSMSRSLCWMSSKRSMGSPEGNVIRTRAAPGIESPLSSTVIGLPQRARAEGHHHDRDLGEQDRHDPTTAGRRRSARPGPRPAPGRCRLSPAATAKPPTTTQEPICGASTTAVSS